MPNHKPFDFAKYILAHKEPYFAPIRAEETTYYNLLDNIIVVGETQ